jgi:CRP-like cAMP-binding protein
MLEINWRSTQIATIQDSVAIVPNSIIAKSRLENRSAPTPARSIIVTFAVDAMVDPQRCIATLDAAVQACRSPVSQPKPTINCTNLQGDGGTYEVRFVVGSSNEIGAARTEMLLLAHRHLRHAGIPLAVAGTALLAPAHVPTIAELIAESDVFGSLAADERALLAGQFAAVARDAGDTLVRQGEMPESLFLLASGTIELTRAEGATMRVLLRASPGDSVGMISLITGAASVATATALTQITAYSLDKTAIAKILRSSPELGDSLEAQAKRGQAWFRCEAAAHEDESLAKPEMLRARVLQFLRRLNS